MTEPLPKRFGDYRLLRKIAHGGMAEIFLAENRTGSVVAIKRLLPHFAEEERFIRMFIDEAHITSHLDHPNIVAVHDDGKIGGSYYIAMEFVQGHSLFAVSERARAAEASLPFGLSAFVVAELLNGLDHAHLARDSAGQPLGVVHRDVTPQNILLSYDGDVKLLDFGVAKARTRLTHTEAGFTKGKLSYMSPEQARGDALDHRSDLFSVGIILYELTTRSRLFDKDGPGGILSAIVNHPIPRPSSRCADYPEELEAIVMRGLAQDVEGRWRSAGEMRLALLRFVRRQGPRLPPGRPQIRKMLYDLFGPPDFRTVVDAGAGVTEGRASASARVPGRNPAASAGWAGRSTGARGEGDQTRMLSLGNDDLPTDRVRGLEETRAAVPEAPDPVAREEAGGFEPPHLVRGWAARFSASRASDLVRSWRAHRRGWWWGLGAVGLVGLVGFGLVSGAFVRVGRGRTADAEVMQQAREAAGVVQRAPVDAAHVPTVLRVSTEPPGATVHVNGIGMGSVTPVVLEDLPVGRPLELTLVLSGYRGHVESVSLRPDQGTRELNFILVRKRGSVAVRSEPDGATVSVDGRPGGVTPARIDRLDAERPIDVRVSKRGYIARSGVVVLADGEHRTLDFRLAIDPRSLPPGRISVESSPSGCAAYIDGAHAGTTPLSGFTASVGVHAVRVECKHHAEQTRRIRVQAGKTAQVSMELRPSEFGYLTVHPVPAAGSVVHIDGTRIPAPVEFRKVVAGRHRVMVENPGLNLKREMVVDVAPNARVTRQVNLVH